MGGSNEQQTARVTAGVTANQNHSQSKLLAMQTGCLRQLTFAQSVTCLRQLMSLAPATNDHPPSEGFFANHQQQQPSKIHMNTVFAHHQQCH